MNKVKRIIKSWRKGEPFVWICASAMSMILIMLFILLFVIVKNGLGYFWPSPLALIQLKEGGNVLGEIVRHEKISDNTSLSRVQIKIANRDLYGLDFRWIDEDKIARITYPRNAFVLERKEYGNFFGYLKNISLPQNSIQNTGDMVQRFSAAWGEIKTNKKGLLKITSHIISYSAEMENIRLKILKLKYRGNDAVSPQISKLEKKGAAIQEKFNIMLVNQEKIRTDFGKYKALFSDVSGKTITIQLSHIVRFYQPNSMSLTGKLFHYLSKIRELLFDEPRESNTEGGLLPAIFGTVMMVFIMSLFSVPFGVLAALYLSEYAKDNLLMRLVRISVNNLAGIPSIVYGIFGLGFFIYGIGGSIDRMFFPERLPAPTWGTGGILWASLTLALLTIPVVIIATEEALNAIPKGIREASLSLGATKFQTISRVLIPMASPGIMTGIILAMARAAGEVAPLMITGVVKLAPTLPVDGTFPYFHLDRKFMHLGFHIYDIGFQSPNAEAAKPMVFVTSFLLIVIVLIMSSAAIYLRNIMKKKYVMRGF